jgi:tRNA/tmRNA/rRNA uracil-C5-methylase (TrmA/RlmC/RlmD family)
VSLECPHRPPCPGCPELGRRGFPPDAREALGELCQQSGVALPPLVSGAATGFRRRARLAVRGRTAAPKIGIFEEGSHRVVHIPRCLVHHPAINEVTAALRAAIIETRTPPYSDDADRGLLRYVQVVVERDKDRAQVVLVGNTTVPGDLAGLGQSLTARIGARLHSLWLNGNPGRTNVILGPHWEHASGPEAVEDRLGDATVLYPPGAFGQSHADLAEELTRWVHERVPAERRVVELYAGVGAIGLGLVSRSRSISLNEVAPGGLCGLELGVERLASELRDRVTVLPGPAEDAASAIADADVLIVDPPRKGLGEVVRRAIAAAPPGEVLYVACGLDAFIRDVRALTAGGALRLTELGAFDLFAHTGHVEVVGRLVRPS